MSGVFEFIFAMILIVLGLGAIGIMGLGMAVIMSKLWDRLTRKAPRE